MITNPRKYLPEELIDLYDHARFEFSSLIGRLFQKKAYKYPNIKYINFGCGKNCFDGFLNISQKTKMLSNTDKLKEMGKNARKIALENFTGNKMYENILNSYCSSKV
ncbi:MAG: glycosyltransferase [Candidatus Woesearchaeota archaeon]